MTFMKRVASCGHVFLISISICCVNVLFYEKLTATAIHWKKVLDLMGMIQINNGGATKLVNYIHNVSNM